LSKIFAVAAMGIAPKPFCIHSKYINKNEKISEQMVKYLPVLSHLYWHNILSMNHFHMMDFAELLFRADQEWE
jgi:hypothetical protein